MTARDPFADYDPEVRRISARACRVFSRVWFRFQLRGWERLPPPPALLVGNHSGTGVADVVCLLGEVAGRLPEHQRATGLMSDPLVLAPGLGRLFRGFGAVPASQANARRALAEGHYVLVYPGGELDSMRPLHLPRTVVFGPRRGYVRLALDTGVPVVPVATIGSHWTYPMLPGGAAVARLTQRWIRGVRHPIPATLLPFAGVAAGVAAGWMPPWTIAPAAAGLVTLWPARVTTELLPVVRLGEAVPEGAPEERIEAAHRLIHGQLQAAVTQLRH